MKGCMLRLPSLVHEQVMMQAVLWLCTDGAKRTGQILQGLLLKGTAFIRGEAEQDFPATQPWLRLLH